MRDLLYAYCHDRGIPHRRCGKLIVASSPDEIAVLDTIAARAAACGVTDLRMISGYEARQMEPALHAHAALVSPSTGIVDPHAYLLALQDDFEQAGGIVVNAAGHGAVALAKRTDGLPPAHIPDRFLAKGSYFLLAGAFPFSSLIYQLPDAAGLLSHLIIDMRGSARFGHDVEWIDRIAYSVDPAPAERFYAAIRSYWPGLRNGQLTPSYAGIRPKIAPPGSPVSDFLISSPADHGLRD